MINDIPLFTRMLNQLMQQTRGGACTGIKLIQEAAHFNLIRGKIYHRKPTWDKDSKTDAIIQENYLLTETYDCPEYFDFPFRYFRFHTDATDPFTTQLIIFHYEIDIYDYFAMIPWHKLLYMAHPEKMRDALRPELPPWYYELYTLDTRLGRLIEPLQEQWDRSIAPRVCEISIHIPKEMIRLLIEALMNRTASAAQKGIVLECWRRKKVHALDKNYNPWELIHAHQSRWPLIAAKTMPDLNIPALVQKEWTDPFTTDYLLLSPASQQQWPWGLRTWNPLQLESARNGEILKEPIHLLATFPMPDHVDQHTQESPIHVWYYSPFYRDQLVPTFGPMPPSPVSMVEHIHDFSQKLASWKAHFSSPLANPSLQEQIIEEVPLDEDTLATEEISGPIEDSDESDIDASVRSQMEAVKFTFREYEKELGPEDNVIILESNIGHKVFYNTKYHYYSLLQHRNFHGSVPYVGYMTSISLLFNPNSAGHRTRCTWHNLAYPQMEEISFSTAQDFFWSVLDIYLPEFSMLYHRVLDIRKQGIYANIRFGDLYPRTLEEDITKLITNLYVYKDDHFIRPYDSKAVKYVLKYQNGDYGGWDRLRFLREYAFLHQNEFLGINDPDADQDLLLEFRTYFNLGAFEDMDAEDDFEIEDEDEDEEEEDEEDEDEEE